MRILTWNLWWRFGPWEERLLAIVDTIRSLDPDVTCLQEVWFDEDGRSSADVIADALGHEHTAGEAGWALDGVGFGNAITSRWPLLGREVVALPAGDRADEKRTLVRADVDTPEGVVDVGCTHLNWKFGHSHVRQAQVAAICETMARPPGGRRILCGDLNAEPDSDEIRQLTGRAAVPVPGLVFADAWRSAGHGPGDTWDNANPFAALDREHTRRIDYVLVSWPYPDTFGHPERAELVGTEPIGGVWPSDHNGVVVDLARPPGSTTGR